MSSGSWLLAYSAAIYGVRGTGVAAIIVGAVCGGILSFLRTTRVATFLIVISTTFLFIHHWDTNTTIPKKRKWQRRTSHFELSANTFKLAQTGFDSTPLHSNKCVRSTIKYSAYYVDSKDNHCRFSQSKSSSWNFPFHKQKLTYNNLTINQSALNRWWTTTDFSVLLILLPILLLRSGLFFLSLSLFLSHFSHLPGRYTSSSSSSNSTCMHGNISRSWPAWKSSLHRRTASAHTSTPARPPLLSSGRSGGPGRLNGKPARDLTFLPLCYGCSGHKHTLSKTNESRASAGFNSDWSLRLVTSREGLLLLLLELAEVTRSLRPLQLLL